jgi:hypothetical protein
VIVDRNRERLLGTFLTNHILIEDVIDLFGLGDVAEAKILVYVLVEFLFDDFITEFDALVANVDARPSDKFAYLLLRFSAEATLELTLVVSKAEHSVAGVPPLYAGMGRP